MCRCRVLCVCGIIGVVLSLTACGSAHTRSPYGQADAGYQRQVQLGEKYYQEAMRLLGAQGDAIDALQGAESRLRSVADEQIQEQATVEAQVEALLQKALTADLYHGPAHNNLGVLYMSQDRLYDAANEFTWARKLLPGHPDPRVNLAAVLDAGGQHADAILAARSALEVQMQYMPALQTIALIHVRDRTVDKETLAFLDLIQYRGESQQWRDWARQSLAQLDGRSY